jgi:hypothetical protein
VKQEQEGGTTAKPFMRLFLVRFLRVGPPIYLLLTVLQHYWFGQSWAAAASSGIVLAISVYSAFHAAVLAYWLYRQDD